jgi:MoaA/NifB/PqqE/SkfB family radical SAM enzyme
MKRSPAKLEAVERENNARWKFSELLEDPNILERWEKVRKYFFLRESTYDMTNRCNIKCDGCYYYSGGKQFAQENRDPMSWRDLMKAEKARGITYVVLAGAEPALVPEILQACYDEIDLGCIASNGFKHIAKSVGYKIHVSVWGNEETSARVRKVKNLMPKQIENYQGDPRATFVYTFCRTNIPETYDVVKELAKNNCQVTFNVFSAPVGYAGELRHTPETLAQTRQVMVDLLKEYPDHVLFSHYSAVAHTSGQGLHQLYKCSYPRMNPSVAGGLGRSFRQYRADLTWDRSASCCVPDTDCEDCRHYASGSAVVTARLYRHTGHPDIFKSWLDYVDTYLAVWVMGYDKGKNLCNHFEPAPGFFLD